MLLVIELSDSLDGRDVDNAVSSLLVLGTVVLGPGVGPEVEIASVEMLPWEVSIDETGLLVPDSLVDSARLEKPPVLVVPNDSEIDVDALLNWVSELSADSDGVESCDVDSVSDDPTLDPEDVDGGVEIELLSEDVDTLSVV